MWFVHILKGFFGRGFLICPSVLEAPKPVFSLWRLASGVFSFVKDPLSLQLLVLSFLLNFAERHLAAPWTWSGFPSCWTKKGFLSFKSFKKFFISDYVMIIVIPNCYHQTDIVIFNFCILITNLSPCWMCCMCTSTQSWNTFRIFDQAGKIYFFNQKFWQKVYYNKKSLKTFKLEPSRVPLMSLTDSFNAWNHSFCDNYVFQSNTDF